jgi:hypothetical protein
MATTIWVINWYNDNCDGGIAGYWAKKPTKAKLAKFVKEHCPICPRAGKTYYDLLPLTEVG